MEEKKRAYKKPTIVFEEKFEMSAIACSNPDPDNNQGCLLEG